MKLRSFILGDLLYAAVLGAALVALGIGFSLTSPSGEQSKLAYDGDLWCVSNYIEARDPNGQPVYLPEPDGRPRKDERLDSKIDWIRKEQVEAESKEEAEQKATSEYFKSSNADELRAWLDANDKANFTTHFNTGATTPGPCLGSGYGNGMAGKWVNDGLNEDCFDMPSGSGNPIDIYNAKAFTAEQINAYLTQKSPKSPLNGKGQAFVDAGLKYEVNPGFLVGIADAESSLGIQCQTSGNLLNGTNNAFGLTAGGQTSFQKFSSYEEGIAAAARNAATGTYKQLNGSIKEFRLKWCGYEVESENSGVTLSDGTKITYDCKNGSSSWEAEVQVVLGGISATLSLKSSDTQTGNPGNAPAKENRPDYCPDKPMSDGPSTGEDYQLRLAKQYEEILSAQNKPVGGDSFGGTKGVDITGTGECALPIPGKTKFISGLGASRGSSQHRGLDFSAPTGTSIVSVLDGTVVLVEDFGYPDGSGHWGTTSQNGGFGNLLRIQHDNGTYSEYHHIKTGSLRVNKGDRVVKGQVVAQVDHNGWSSGPHLHFQMMTENDSTRGYFDPSNCLGI